LRERLSATALNVIGDKSLQVSPIAILELQYLHEVRKARDSVATMLTALRGDVGLQVADVSLEELIDVARDLSWTRDPFDRLIAAHAIVANAPLVTADETIREHLSLAVWD
jgi:PIN domain nuclease of toxin-antitoxin system